MERKLLDIIFNPIAGTLPTLVSCLGFSSCKTRIMQRMNEGGKSEQPDTATLAKSKPRPDGMDMVMYDTSTTMFELKQIAEPEKPE